MTAYMGSLYKDRRAVVGNGIVGKIRTGPVLV